MKMRLFLMLILFVNCFTGKGFGQSVGSTDGVFNVSDMGAANYSIPITVPDGVGGLQPNIGLAYSSQGGNGPLGMGWSISGLSSITRSGNNIYSDKKVNGVSLTMDDKFALDGNKLILTSGSTYGAANTGYNTEIETFREIRANGSLGNGPLSFTVKNQHGLTYEYGGTGGYVIAEGSTTPYMWLIKKITDLNGNFMTFSYYFYGGIAFPKEIAYNQNVGSSAAPANFIKFTYLGLMNSDAFGYLAGGKMNNYVILKTIRVVYNGGTERIYRSYTMNYDNDFFPHLKTITEKGTDEAEALKPTEFEYGVATSMSYENAMQNIDDGTYAFISLDYNADGLSDMVKIENGGGDDARDWKLLKNTGNNTFASVQSGAFPYLNNTNGVNEKLFESLNFWKHTSVFDYNGDGYDDMMIKNEFNDLENARFSIYLSNGSTGFNLLPYTIRKPDGTDFGENDTYTGDFDGDGKAETIVLARSPGNKSYIIGQKYLVPTSFGYTPYEFDAPFFGSSSEIYVIDYNRDGKSDIMWVNGGYTWIFNLNVTFDVNNNPVVASPVFTMVNTPVQYPSIWHDINIGDFNGDGITDVLTYFSDANQTIGWEIGYGNGKGNFILSPTQPPVGGANKVTVADFNGDGKSDIFVNSPSSRQMYYSKGNDAFVLESSNVSELTNQGFAFSTFSYCLGDFNGDGSSDFMAKTKPNHTLKLITFHPNETRHLLSKIKNGLGSETRINYKSLSNSTVYSPGTNTYTYPYIKRTIPFKVVSKVNADNGINAYGNNTLYTYEGLKFNAHGKGLMGFDKITAFDNSTLISQQKIFSLNTNYAFPYLLGIATRYNNTNHISGVTNSYGVYDYGNKRIFPYQISSQQNNALTGETSTTTNSYSFPGIFQVAGQVYSHDIGKPFSITISKGLFLETSVQSFTYPSKTNTPVYVYSKPSIVTTANTRQNQTAYTRTASFSYDYIKGNLSNTVSDPGTINEVTTTFHYDMYGNPTYKKTAAAGLPDKEEYMDYDPTHRYVIKSYNGAFPNVAKRAWYYSFTGLKFSDTDPDDFTTMYAYDGFGRLITTSNSNGQSSTNSYVWGGLPPSEPFNVGGCYYTGTVSNTGAESYTIYDRLGRDHKTSNKNTQNEWVHVAKSYNVKGQLISTTKPYSGMTFNAINYTYDAYGRSTQIAAPEGNTSFSYQYTATYPPGTGDYTVTQINAAGQQSKTMTDRSGRKRETRDAMNNNLIYNYNSNSNVKEVISGSTILQSYLYDAYGRLEERFDPNYGIYKYTYDAYGQTLTLGNIK